jgi:Na+/proline symporter
MEINMFLFMGLCFGISALGLLGGAVWAYIKQQRTMESRVAATGTVVELTTQVTQRGSIFCPVVEFTVPSGETIRFTSEFGSRPAGHKIGQSVNVRYDAVDPQKAEIESTMNRWLVPLILVFMGVIACCLAVAFLGIYALGPSSFSQ